MMQQPNSDATLLGWLCPPDPVSGLGELGCLLATYEVPVLLVAAVVVGVVVRLIWQWWERRQAARTSLLVFPLSGSEAMDPAELDERRRQADSARRQRREAEGAAEAEGAGAEAEATRMSKAASPDADPAPPRSVHPDAARQPPPGSNSPQNGTGRQPADPAATTPSTDPPASGPAASGPTASGSTAPGSTAPGPTAPGPTAVIGGAMEGTLQLLPGRLELLEGGGGATAREVRFVRVPGRDPEVTFGREDGDPFLHVRLDLPTVSRRQARLRFHRGRWFLHNESRTNPTMVEGEPLPPGGAGRVLNDGDQVEMGTVVYRFHQPGATGGAESPVEGLPERSSWFSDQGRRSSNQDAVAVRTLPDGRELAVICDGIGSHSHGRTASHLALDTLISTLEEGADLKAGVRAADLAIRARVEEDPELSGMGTTMVALLRDGAQYEIANVGDSRAYRLDGDGITLLTQDHSFAAEVRRDGSMSEEELARSPWRNAITRHLGAEGELEVDLFGRFEALEPHIVILCSDGLHGTLDDQTLARLARKAILAERDLRRVARTLGEEALRRGSDDNVSVVTLTFKALSRGRNEETPGWIAAITGEIRDPASLAEVVPEDGNP